MIFVTLLGSIKKRMIEMNFGRWLIVLWAYLLENSYFGWNLGPKSDAEMIADLIILIMVILSIREKNNGYQ